MSSEVNCDYVVTLGKIGDLFLPVGLVTGPSMDEDQRWCSGSTYLIMNRYAIG